MKASTMRRLALVLVVLHFPILAAGFFGPYDPTHQFRDYPFAAPQRPHAIRVFVHGDRYSLLGVFDMDRHLFGTSDGKPVFLLGSDEFGRDQLSRWLAGGQVSLLAGALAALVAISVGLGAGALAGFAGGAADLVIMRASDVCTALPWLYVLIGLRALMPLRVSTLASFFIIVFTVGAVGWVRPARLVRGLVLSAKERPFVTAARGFGASERYILSTHVLPATFGALLTQAALIVPQFVVAEVMLSFLGLGVPDPTPSWGNLLMPLQRYSVLVSHWWMYVPAALTTMMFLVYYQAGDAIHARRRPVAV